jgi:hypothetical protein
MRKRSIPVVPEGCDGMPPNKKKVTTSTVDRDESPIKAVLSLWKGIRISHRVFISILCAVSNKRVGKNSPLYGKSYLIEMFRTMWGMYFLPLNMAIIVRWYGYPTTANNSCTFDTLGTITAKHGYRPIVIDSILCTQKVDDRKNERFIGYVTTKWHTGKIVHNTKRLLKSPAKYTNATPQCIALCGSTERIVGTGKAIMVADSCCHMKHVPLQQLYTNAIASSHVNVSPQKLLCGSAGSCHGCFVWITPSIVFHGEKHTQDGTGSSCLYDLEKDAIQQIPKTWVWYNTTPVHGAGVVHIFCRDVSLMMANGRTFNGSIPPNEVLHTITNSGILVTTTNYQPPKQTTHHKFIFRDVALWLDDPYTADAAETQTTVFDDSAQKWAHLYESCSDGPFGSNNKIASFKSPVVISIGLTRAIVFDAAPKTPFTNNNETVCVTLAKRMSTNVTLKKNVYPFSLFFPIIEGKSISIRTLGEDTGIVAINAISSMDTIYQKENEYSAHRINMFSLSIVNLDKGQQLLRVNQTSSPQTTIVSTKISTAEKGEEQMRDDMPVIFSVSEIVENAWAGFVPFNPTSM